MEQTLQIIQTMVSLPSTLGSSFTTDTELKPRVSCANSRSRMGADRSTIGPLERWMGKRKSSWCSASLPFAMSWSSRLVTLVPSLLRCAASNSSVVATSTMITQAHISFTLWVAWLETVLCVCFCSTLFYWCLQHIGTKNWDTSQAKKCPRRQWQSWQISVLRSTWNAGLPLEGLFLCVISWTGSSRSTTRWSVWRNTALTPVARTWSTTCPLAQ